jgi:hypothetical protein
MNEPTRTAKSTENASLMLLLAGGLTLAFNVVSSAMVILSTETITTHFYGLGLTRILLFIIYVPSCFIVGAALKRRTLWARVAGIIVSVVSLSIFFPIGPILGVLALIFWCAVGTSRVQATRHLSKRT